ncbi:MAG: YceI family protein [Pseudomonadota bacterium]
MTTSPAGQQRYSGIAMALHWMIAAMLAFQLGLGRGLEELTIATGLFDVTQLHKSIGITILVLSVLRLVWRWLNPPPPALPDNRLNHALAKAVHIGLYAFMIGAPLTGWLMVSTSKLDIDTLLFNTLPWPDIPWVGSLEAGSKSALNDAAEWTHGALGWVGVALFALHIAGALRHQWLRREPLLARIWPGSLGHRANSGAVIIALLVAAALSLALWGQNRAGLQQQGRNGSPAPDTASTREKPVSSAPVSDETAPEDAVEGAGDDPEDTEENDTEAETVAEEADKPEQPSATAYDWSVSDRQPIGFAFDWNGETVRGTFSDWRAAIRFGADALDQSSIDVTIGLASARTGEAQVDEALPGADFFAIATSPQARFRSSSIRSLGGNRYEAPGTLSLRGVSQPVTLRFTLDIQGNSARANGNASINRAAFGIAEGNYGALGDTVQVRFTFSAER